MLPGGALDMGKFRRTVPAGLGHRHIEVEGNPAGADHHGAVGKPISAFFTMLAQGSSGGSRRSALE